MILLVIILILIIVVILMGLWMNHQVKKTDEQLAELYGGLDDTNNPLLNKDDEDCTDEQGSIGRRVSKCSQ